MNAEGAGLLRLISLLLAILVASESMGQSNDDAVSTREDQIQAQRIEKASAVPAPVEKSKVASGVSSIANLISRSPFKVGVRGRGPGAGLTVGYLPEWRLSGNLVSKSIATGTLDKFYTVGTGLELQNISNQDLTLSLTASHSDAPQLRY